MPFFPLSDQNPLRITPYLTYSLIAVNTALFAISVLVFATSSEMLMNHFAAIPSQMFDDIAPHSPIPEWLTPITSSFFHANLGHLFGNMLFFYIFADNLEDAFGRVRFFLFCMASALLTGLAEPLANMGSDIPIIGFSGVVSACLGAYLILYPKAKVNIINPLGIFALLIRLPFTFYIPAWILMVVYFSLDVFGLVTVDTSEGGVAYLTHISGFIFGLLSATLLKKNETDYEAYLHRGSKPTVIRTRADDILDKYKD